MCKTLHKTPHTALASKPGHVANKNKPSGGHIKITKNEDLEERKPKFVFDFGFDQADTEYIYKGKEPKPKF